MTWGAIISAVVSGLFGALFAALRLRRQDGEHDAAVSGLAVDEAALETQEVVNDVADARAGLPAVASDPDDLARELRAERTTTSAGRRRRPF
jgi:hypothetical protein